MEEYPHDKRLEEIRPGVWVAFDYALANVLIIERNSEWERAAKPPEVHRKCTTGSEVL